MEKLITMVVRKNKNFVDIMVDGFFVLTIYKDMNIRYYKSSGYRVVVEDWNVDESIELEGGNSGK